MIVAEDSGLTNLFGEQTCNVDAHNNLRENADGFLVDSTQQGWANTP